MVSASLAVLAALAGVANAHFRIGFPPPRGPFVADEQVNFCSGYNEVSNRTLFPLDGGFFQFNTSHGPWTLGVIISTSENPTSFGDFAVDGEQQFVRYFSSEEAGGSFCIPLNISEANIEGAVDGANVTIQYIYQAGDGDLYQCSDLTLSSDLVIDSSITCANETTHDDHGDGEGHSEDDGHDHGDDEEEGNSEGSGSDSGALQAYQLPILASMVMGAAGIALSVL
ncbi:hypothetical protein AX16_005560 [Volvariella volvacea WC 439]|nr:hypothetical protein AX16_005560 [Volvariella volvacea WC 439]